jgi:hypothetical protein
MALSLLEAADYIARLPREADKAAQLSINQVASRGALKLARSEILDQINFPKDYLTGDRLRVTKMARPGDLEAVIGARQRATSLARFADSSTTLGSRARVGVRVRVKRGNSTLLKKAWLVNLRNGNIGLAVRLKPGQSIDNKTGATRWLVPGKVALLYGPSVDQVFRDVSEDIAGPVGSMVATEFFRQLTRFTR